MKYQNGYIKIVSLIIILGIASLIILNFKKAHAPESNINTDTFENPQTEQSIEEPVVVQPPVQKTSIHNSWKWISTTDYEGVIIKPQSSDDFVLTISKEGKLSSTTDCNSLSGSIIINDEVLSVGPLVSTKMACAGETLESRYSFDLARAVSYSIEGDMLNIKLLQDVGVMQFKKAE